MNRRLNTILFLAGATVVNILLLFFYFLAFQGLAALFLPDRTGFLAVGLWALLLAAAIGAAWFTYRWAFRILKDRVPLETWLDPELLKGLF